MNKLLGLIIGVIVSFGLGSLPTRAAGLLWMPVHTVGFLCFVLASSLLMLLICSVKAGVAVTHAARRNQGRCRRRCKGVWID